MTKLEITLMVRGHGCTIGLWPISWCIFWQHGDGIDNFAVGPVRFMFWKAGAGAEQMAGK